MEEGGKEKQSTVAKLKLDKSNAVHVHVPARNAGRDRSATAE
jgi:hypothetical protein